MSAAARPGTAGRVVACGLLLGALLGPASAVALPAAAAAPRAVFGGADDAAEPWSAEPWSAEPGDAPHPRAARSCGPPVVRPELTRDDRASVRLRRGGQVLPGPVDGLAPCRRPGSASSLWVVVNKGRPLSPLTYVPSGLVVPDVTNPQGVRMRQDAAAAVVDMFRAAQAAGAGSMSIASGYRSYEKQASIHRHRISTHGRGYADAWIARPGHSEHQTGLALDVAPVGSATCAELSCLASTTQGRWLRANAWRYGFVLRYEPGLTGVTGFNPEPWHFRFVGTLVAADYHAGGWHSLEQYFGLAAQPSY